VKCASWSAGYTAEKGIGADRSRATEEPAACLPCHIAGVECIAAEHCTLHILPRSSDEWARAPTPDMLPGHMADGRVEDWHTRTEADTSTERIATAYGQSFADCIERVERIVGCSRMADMNAGTLTALA
jgi:hypothetical protein